MATPVKDDAEKVKVTTGRDFVAAKPTEAAKAPEKEPETQERDANELAALSAKLDEREASHRRRVEELEEREAELKRQEHDLSAGKENLEAAQKKLAVIAASESKGQESNRRGKPIPVAEETQKVRSIADIGGNAYNGKPETMVDED